MGPPPAAAQGTARITPLLGRRVPTAAMAEGTTLFESALSTHSPAFLAEHVVFGGPIVPGAGFLEMALSAGTRELGNGDVQLESVAVSEALPASHEETTVQLVLDTPEDGARGFRIFSLRPTADGEPESWALHVQGRVRRADSSVDAPGLEELEAGDWTTIAPEQFYAAFAEAGLEYGPLFSNIVELRARADEALSRVRLPEALAGSNEFRVHPALLDACFQTAAAALVGADIEDLFLPIGMEAVRVLGQVGDEVVCHTRVVEGSTSERSIRLNLHLFRERPGTERALEPVLIVEGLQLVRADAAALRRADETARALLHAVQWQPASRDSDTAVVTGQRATLIGGDETSQALRKELERQGCSVAAKLGVDASIVVFLGGLMARPGDEPALCGELLTLAQALVRSSDPHRLTIVTRGAQPAGGAVAPEQAALMGLANTIALEHPELGLRRIDLDPAGDDGEAARLADELLGPDAETMLALRGTERLVPRLARLASLAATELTEPGDAYEVRARSYGSLENLELRSIERRAPADDEVEVELGATALNFKDVLHTLGMLQEWSEARGIHRAPEQPLGFEGAGTIVRVGGGVTNLALGDRVVVSWPGALATHVTVPASVCFEAPGGLDLAEAAALPTVFQTALYGLERCAKLKRGERVLIHAAAGGVGQAALQLAQRVGAEVYATASPSKHAFLRAQGVKHIFHSRHLDFADELLSATNDEGVDVVLNSLAGEFVDASLRCLRDGGRFVEIGKIGVKSESEMRAVRADVEYFLFDLSETLDESSETLSDLQADVIRGFAEGSLAPLPIKRFPARRAVDAFQYLAQARNIGKVVLTLPAGEGSAPSVRADRSYLLTGGLGALGLVIARRLVDDGARHLVLCGRRGLGEADEETKVAVAALEADGATVRCVAVDVSAREKVAALLETIARDLPPLAGVVHCAGVLDDGMILQLAPERFEAVLAPKVAGTRNLDELTRGLPLDFFVMFSSMAALLGAQGQASYAAGNAVMDAIAHQRVADGLPALSIQWGPWSGGGMAASLASRNQVRFAEMGLKSIAPEEGAQLFSRLLGEDRPQVAVLPITWSKFLRQLQKGGVPPFLEGFAAAAETSGDDRHALMDQLLTAPPDERVELLADFLERQLTRVLGFGASTRIDPRRNFGDLGVDSLLAVDLRNRLEASLDASLPATLLFDYPNLEALVGYLTGVVLGGLGAQNEEVTVPKVPAETVESLDDLSEDEIASRLAAEIDALSRE